jgi:histidinol-phosphatase (PHP family)
MIDQHTHTVFSPDASKEATFENYLTILNQKKVKAITFTDHCDFDCPAPLFNQIPDFVSFKRRLHQAQESTDTLLQMGVELGYQPHVLEAMKQLVAAHPFDTVLLSVHYMDGLDPYGGEFFRDKTLTQSYQRYFETALEAIKTFDGFHILAHLDYIFRYSLEKTDAVNLTPFYDVLDAIFETLITKNKVLELNTSPYRKDYQNKTPNLDIIKRYFEKGGRLISLGSDAHTPKDVGADFDQAKAFLKSTGFKTLTWVKQGTLVSVEL